MKPKISGDNLRVIMLTALLVITGLYVYFQYYFVPTSQRLASLESQLRTARDSLKTLEAATANEAVLQAQYKQVEHTVAALRKSLPNESELPAVMEVLSNLASKSSVKIQTIFPERQSAAVGKFAGADPAIYREIPIQIDAVAGFHQLATFLNQVELGDKPMQVLSMRISANPRDSRRHQVNLIFRAYFSVTADGNTGV